MEDKVESDIINRYHYLIERHPKLLGWVFNFMLVYSKKRSAMLLEMLNVEFKNNFTFKQDILKIVEETDWLEYISENTEYQRILVYNKGENVQYALSRNEDLVRKLKYNEYSRNVTLGKLLDFLAPDANTSEGNRRVVTYTVNNTSFMTQIINMPIFVPEIRDVDNQLESYRGLANLLGLKLGLQFEDIVAAFRIEKWFNENNMLELWEARDQIFNEIAQHCVVGRESELKTYKVMHTDYYTFILNILPIRIMYNLSLETPWSFFYPPTEENEEILFEMYKKIESNIYDCLRDTI